MKSKTPKMEEELKGLDVNEPPRPPLQRAISTTASFKKKPRNDSLDLYSKDDLDNVEPLNLYKRKNAPTSSISSWKMPADSPQSSDQALNQRFVSQ